MDELRRIRKERGLSQQRLADLASVDKVTIVHIEGGKVSPKVETLEKLAAALEVDLADLFPKAQRPLFQELPDPATQEERRVLWADAVDKAQRLRETDRQRMEEALSAWRASKERGEPSDERRGLRATMGELLQQAYDAEWALWALMSGADNALNLNAVDLDDFKELQEADRFYVDLWRMVQRAEGLSIRPGAEETTGTPETVNAGDSPPAARPEEVVELEAA
jgi:transcriptional regulator with XRE-family HTH domain